MADDKMKSKDAIPPDKQAHTDIAERQGKEGDQARIINEEQSEKGAATSRRREGSA